MSLGPFDVLPVIALIRNAVSTTLLREVAGAAEAAAAVENAKALPGAYVMLGSERPAPKSGASGRVVQQVTTTFGVLIGLRDYRAGARGEKAIDPLTDVIVAVRGAVVGYAPDVYHTACEMAGSRLQSYRTGALWWLETFRTHYHADKVI